MLTRQTAFRALAQRAGAGSDSRGLAAAAHHAYEDLARVSTPLIGKVAVNALTGRALYLVQRQYPWLAASRDGREWSGPFAQVENLIEQQTPAVAAEAVGSILATLADWLVTVVGQALATKPLRLPVRTPPSTRACTAPAA